MTSPHSLTFSSPNPRRNSLTQLPLPQSGMNTPTSVHSQPHTPNTSIIPASASSSTKLRSPNSPTSSTFPITPGFPIHTSTTHTGGIQPPASFFHPSRPHYSPPDSPASHINMHEDREVFQLANLKRNSDSTEGHSEMAHASPNGLGIQEPPSMKGTKLGREPLLPIGERPRANKRNSVGRDGYMTRPQHSKTGSNRLRTSLDLVLNLRRGLSIDSHRSNSSPNPAGHRQTHSISSEGGFGSIGDKRIDDAERGIPTTTHFTSLRRHHSASSSHDPSLFVASTPDSSRTAPIPAGYKPKLSRSKSIQVENEKQYPFAVPMYTPRGQIIRRWQLHPSRNRFALRGHILTGGDSPWAFIVTFAVACAISGLWFATTCQWWWSQEGAGGKVLVCIGGYLSLLVFSNMLKAAFTDPGILPRNLDLDPPYPSTSPSDGGVRAPMPRDLKVRADVVRVKYCPTCKTYRPPRSSHCKMCDNCVDGCDHHCQWLNNCVGRRNYTSFFVLLITAVMTLLLVIATSIVHVYFLTRQGIPDTNTGPISFKQAISTNQGAGSAAVFCLSAAVILPVAALLTYHVRLLLLNITTIEQIRNQAHKSLVR